jgi:hypothetical protein
VTASIEEHLVALRHSEPSALSREDRLEQERAVVRDIVRQYGSREEQLGAWARRTGKSGRAFYRRLAEIDSR